MLSSPPVTRFAPSPTGQIHVGNVWSFLVAWLFSRSYGGRIYLRMDDIDQKRSRPEYAEAILSDLEWLGLDWDDWRGNPILYQSSRFRAYGDSLARLLSLDLVYPCFCTRREIRMLAGAPHPGDEGAPYSGKCAGIAPARAWYRCAQGESHCLRFRSGEEDVKFDDLIFGRQMMNKRAWGGDFALKRSDGAWSYQLASVVDDAEMGVNLVVRGRDILPSTPRQILLARALGLPVPTYAHLPLVLDYSGERLAKRHGSLSVAALRAGGLSPEQIIGKLAFLAGFIQKPDPLSAHELLAFFRLELIQGNDIFLPKQFLKEME